MAATYLIRIVGVTSDSGVSPESLGVRIARRELVSWGPSRVILDVTNEALAAPYFSVYRDTVVISRDGVRWFIGRTRKITMARSGATHAQSIELADFWWDFERIQYRQRWDGEDSERVTTGIAGTRSTNLNSGLQMGALNALSYSSSSGSLSATPTTAEEMENVIGYAKYNGGAPVNLGAIEGSQPVPPSTRSNRNSREMLNNLAAASPNLLTWADYSSTPPDTGLTDANPTVHIVDSANVEAVTLDLADSIVSDVRLSPRDDLRLGRVDLTYEHVEDGASIQASTESEISNAALGHLRATLALPEAARWDTAGTADLVDPTTTKAQATLPAGLASSILSAYGQRYFEGEIVLKEDEPGGSRYLGKVINLTGGPVEWETMRAQVIAVSEDILAGITTLGVGPSQASERPERAVRAIAPNVTAPAARNNETNPPGTTPSEQARDPHETYVSGNVIYVHPGLCGRDEAGDEVETDRTGPGYSHGTIGLGGEVNLYLGVSIIPEVLQVAGFDSDGNLTAEYLATGVGKVSTARVQTNDSSPTPQPAIVNAETGEVTQMAVIYFLLGTVTWPSGPTPTVQVVRDGNFDVLLIPPNSVRLRAMV